MAPRDFRKRLDSGELVEPRSHSVIASPEGEAIQEQQRGVTLDCFGRQPVHALFAREPGGANREERLAGLSLAMTLFEPSRENPILALGNAFWGDRRW